MISPPLWNREQLEAARCEAIARFRRERLGEPHQAYLRLFDEQRVAFRELLQETDDLAQIEISRLLLDRRRFEAVRYLAGPPISEDDLKTLADAAAITTARMSQEPGLRARVLEVIRATLDDRRFPWVAERRAPGSAERDAAVLASAALLATRRTETSRRMGGKQGQEDAVRDAMAGAGLVQTASHAVATVADAPAPG